jgi:hypothetical protein
MFFLSEIGDLELLVPRSRKRRILAQAFGRAMPVIARLTRKLLKKD